MRAAPELAVLLRRSLETQHPVCRRIRQAMTAVGNRTSVGGGALSPHRCCRRRKLSLPIYGGTEVFPECEDDVTSLRGQCRDCAGKNSVERASVAVDPSSSRTLPAALICVRVCVCLSDRVLTHSLRRLLSSRSQSDSNIHRHDRGK